ncbi:MAG: winged helix-turn-helix transcriptional regulator [Candidatus Diapherotrites archaeon]|nr:winged helix-turn-helix transcriptional regulator [Candidatus Diapherotrites archaeon]
MRKTLFCIFAVLLAGTAFAAELDFEIIRVALDEKGDAFVQHFLEFDSRTEKSVSIHVFGSGSLRVFDSQGEVPFTNENGVISFAPNSLEEKYSVTVEYFTSSLTSKTGEQWSMALSFEQLNQPIEDLKIELGLPLNVVVLNFEPKGILFSGDEHLEIEWSFPGTVKDVQASVTYSLNGTNGGKNGFDFMLATWIVGAILVIGGGGYYLVSRKKTGKGLQPVTQPALGKPLAASATAVPIPGAFGSDKPIEAGKSVSTKQEGILKFLSDNERRIMDELMNTSPLPQRSLQVKLGLPKSTLSRTIKKLEVKGLVKTIDIGNSKRLELGEEFVKAGSE